jgi:hypothetical protein
MTLNGAFHPEPPARVSVTVWLPEGVQKILHSDNELTRHPPSENGRVAYSWEEFNLYPTSFTILWSTQQIDLSVKDFVPSEFEAVEPEEEFWFPEVEESDPHLYWAKRIDELQPGEVMTVQYVLKYIGDTSMVHTIQLKPCRVTAGGFLVGVSDRVSLYQRVGVTIDTEMEIEAPVEEAAIPPTWLLIAIVGAAFGFGLILLGAFIAWRRR